MKLLVVTCVAGVVLAGRSAVAQEEDVLSQVRLADMWKVVEVFSKLDRTSSSAGEREAAEYLKAQLEQYGIRHRMHEVRSYLSVPVSASLQILSPSNFSVPSITPSFSGSTGYAGAFFQDLYDNAVAYLAIDSPGVRSATAIEAEGMFEAKGFLDSVLRDKAGVEREATRNFRYNDEALWGIGVPSLTFYPAIPLGHPDRAKVAGGSAYGFWWHTKEDDFEKADKDLGLRGAKELGAIDPSSDEAGFIQTELLRESNQIHQALDRARPREVTLPTRHQPTKASRAVMPR